jgi:multidrug resistance protein, MATE family
MGTVSIVFWLVPEAIVAIYLDIHDPANFEVMAIATTLLRVAAVFQLMDGTQVVAAGALRGLKDTRAPMAIGFNIRSVVRTNSFSSAKR